MTLHYGPAYPKETYSSHGYPELTVDLGEVVLNYAVTGPELAPALLLIPGLVESWWAFEPVMKLLENEFRIYAIDKRGQGRSSQTPGRYTLDNWGNDANRFIEHVIERPALVAGSSLGGLAAAWLAAYASPGVVRAVYLEDVPLFTSELAPACGVGVQATAVGLLFKLFATHFGDQWSVGDWENLYARAEAELPDWILAWIPSGDEPPQNQKEFDPEGARAMVSGTASLNCDQKRMLKSVKTPVLFTHHYRGEAPVTGIQQGAISDLQVNYARTLVEQAGQRFEYRSLPDKGHALHADEPELYASIVREWAQGLA